VAGLRVQPSGEVRGDLIERVAAARVQTDQLFDILKPSALYERPIPERHRLIFYLGHLEAFDWNQIGRAGLGAPSFHSGFDQLFEFGIDPPPGKAPEDRPSDWPSVAEVRAYNTRVREQLDELLMDAPSDLLNIAIEHRMMHAETLAYLFHNLAYEHKHPVPADTRLTARPLLVEHQMVSIPSGSATLGQRAGEFGWDNEFDEHRVQVAAFQIRKYKITNAEYLEFVRAGASPPHFWARRDGQWFYRGMFAEFPLPLDHPVYVTYREAAAYAQSSGKSLLTEAQFHRAAYGTTSHYEQAYPWGEPEPGRMNGNFDFQHWDPVAVTSAPHGDSAFGVSQLVGNGWEWTVTPFAPFAGFCPYPTYPGYSQNFFDGEHYVLKGASPRTAACFLRRSFRNWFRPDYPYVYASFRLTEN
jgi:formylglycine-generating enzyme required for sulfatase activity